MLPHRFLKMFKKLSLNYDADLVCSLCWVSVISSSVANLNSVILASFLNPYVLIHSHPWRHLIISASNHQQGNILQLINIVFNLFHVLTVAALVLLGPRLDQIGHVAVHQGPPGALQPVEQVDHQPHRRQRTSSSLKPR